VTVRVSSARVFVSTLAADGRQLGDVLGRLGVRGIEDFFVSYCSDHGLASRRNMQSALRLFLRFTASRGLSRYLVGAVPSIRTYRLSTVPRGLTDDQVRKLLASLGAAEVSARNRAIILLLATYGVRRSQISMLDHNDIDWRGRTLTFCPHKGGLTVTHVLTALVAEAIAAYLREERPPSDGSAVFLRAVPPYIRLSPSAITEVVRVQLERAGIQAAPAGPHALRHAFATRLLRAGQSFKTIADLLGHQSLSATAVYAKVDTARLSELAVPWPEVSP
jgi:integrase